MKVNSFIVTEEKNLSNSIDLELLKNKFVSEGWELNENGSMTKDGKTITPIVEGQLKGVKTLTDKSKSLVDLTFEEKVKFLKGGKGDIITFNVPTEYKERYNFWQVISSGKIEENAGRFYLKSLPNKGKNSPIYKSVQELVDNIDWVSMESTRKFNESIISEGTVKGEFGDGEVTFSDGEVSSVNYDNGFKYKGKHFELDTGDGDDKGWKAGIKKLEKEMAKEFKGTKFVLESTIPITQITEGVTKDDLSKVKEGTKLQLGVFNQFKVTKILDKRFEGILYDMNGKEMSKTSTVSKDTFSNPHYNKDISIIV